MPPEIKTATFRGKRYRIIYQKTAKHKLPKGTRGACDPPTNKGKTILITRGSNETENLDTILHEALHACYWDLEEDAIDEAAEDIARFLWRYGYRPPEKVVVS